MQKNTEPSAVEQQLFALMAVTEEQQNTTRLQQETLAKQQKTTQDLQQQLQTIMQNQCEKQAQQHANFLQEQHYLFNMHHTELNKLIDWRHLFFHVAMVAVLSLAVVLAALWYLSAVDKKIEKAHETMKAFDLLDADITYCDTVARREPLPCVRVRTELGGHGKDKNYWVIDQE